MCLTFLMGCGTSVGKNVNVTTKDGVSEFLNDMYTFADILNICNGTLESEYKISDACSVTEMYVYTETDGCVVVWEGFYNDISEIENLTLGSVALSAEEKYTYPVENESITDMNELGAGMVSGEVLDYDGIKFVTYEDIEVDQIEKMELVQYH